MKRLILKLLRVQLNGTEHLHALDASTVIICNHQSFLDPLILALCLPRGTAFAMNTEQAQKWYFRPLGRFVDIFSVDPMRPISTKNIIQRLRQGGQVVIFPEGRITVTGGIMKVYDGAGMIIDRTQARVLPLRIEGAQYTLLSRMEGKLRRRLWPRITLTAFPPRHLEIKEQRGPARRRALTQALYDLLVETAFLAQPTRQPLLHAFHQAAHRHGWKRQIVTDPAGAELSYRTLSIRAEVLKKKLEAVLGPGQYMGVLLPTSPGALVTLLALWGLRRTPALLNATAGERALQSACKAAALNTILTSRTFIERAKLETVVEALKQCRIIYLEDIRETVTAGDKLRAMVRSFFPRLPTPPADEPAVVLFTSGSEGMPKGVVLSHANILSNIAQAAARFDFTESDIMFNPLPMFHSFGLVAGALLPVWLGIRVILYPTPLHYRIIPELVYDYNATILIGTDTFFNGYARYAKALDFHTLRLAVAGGEKLKPKTRELYAERFRVNILEGYGVTETSPVLACNSPAEHRSGTVGRPMPCMQMRLEPVEGLEKGGRLEVAGPNIMLGYLRETKPGVIEPQGEWYDTGDIVELDAEGFIRIAGRAKRFAKIGGEMVSLAAVEEAAAAVWPEMAHAAVAVHDARKGERIILVSENKDAHKDGLLAYARVHGVPEIALPREIIFMEAIPRLGSGKIDYPALEKLLIPNPALAESARA